MGSREGSSRNGSMLSGLDVPHVLAPPGNTGAVPGTRPMLHASMAASAAGAAAAAKAGNSQAVVLADQLNDLSIKRPKTRPT